MTRSADPWEKAAAYLLESWIRFMDNVDDGDISIEQNTQWEILGEYLNYELQRVTEISLK